MGNIWIRPWANFAPYMDPTFTVGIVNPAELICGFIMTSGLLFLVIRTNYHLSKRIGSNFTLNCVQPTCMRIIASTLESLLFALYTRRILHTIDQSIDPFFFLFCFFSMTINDVNTVDDVDTVDTFNTVDTFDTVSKPSTVSKSLTVSKPSTVSIHQK